MDGKQAVRSLFFIFGCSAVLLALVLILIAPIGTVGAIGVSMEVQEGPIFGWIYEKYNGPFADWLGVGCAQGYRLSDKDAQRLAGTGIPLDAIVAAEQGRIWCGNSYGAKIDIGVILAIMKFESNFGANMGSKDWLQGIRSNDLLNHSYEESSARWLLNYWEENNLRDKSSEAAAQIYPGYTGYYGHGSGEMGDGFLPSTAKWVCQKALMNSSDPDLRSCNFFSRKVNGHAIPWTIYRSGYSSDQGFDDKVANLIGWNRNLAYRTTLVTTAKAINSVVGVVDVIGTIGEIFSPESTPLGDLKTIIIMILEALDLLPDRMGWLEAPLRDEDLDKRSYEDGISQDYMETHYDPRGHPGIDFVCRALGVDVLAVARGIVVKPDPNTLMGYYSITQKDRYFGNNVWINHDGLYAVYAHLEKVNVRAGQRVQQGQVIGQCGSTGHSTGPHVHFQLLDIPPSEMVTYRQENPGNVDPNLYLGTCRVIVWWEEDRKRKWVLVLGEINPSDSRSSLLFLPPFSNSFPVVTPN